MKKIKCLEFKYLENSFVHLGLGGTQRVCCSGVASMGKCLFLENIALGDIIGALHICKCFCFFFSLSFYAVIPTSNSNISSEMFCWVPLNVQQFLDITLELHSSFQNTYIKKQSPYKLIAVLNLGEWAPWRQICHLVYLSLPSTWIVPGVE